jgi:hypothetical protein
MLLERWGGTAYAAQASLYTEAIKNAMGGDCTNIAVLLRCAVSQSGRAICENLQRGSP